MTLIFEAFPKIPRLKRETVVSEKLDGTNAQVAWFALNSEEAVSAALADPFQLAIRLGKKDGDSAMALYAGSRNRWIKPGEDNFAFAKWVVENVDDLESLGEGRHYGEWYGYGIQRGYGLAEKRFALFNTARWNPANPNRPRCCDVVPVLDVGGDDEAAMELLASGGSIAVPGYRRPEGIVVYHSASRQLYKRTFEQDGGKWAQP